MVDYYSAPPTFEIQAFPLEKILIQSFSFDFTYFWRCTCADGKFQF